ncbi:MAG: hypothetical protein ABR961_10005 [Thermoanaerobaculaceae bacterium]|jgi:predicted RNA-binding Zn-ribbon protein involved in translation (DUF1610 family)
MPKTLLLLELECPHCKRVLTKGEKVPLDAFLRDTHQDGQVALSALFGDYTIETDLKIPEGGTVEFRCPECEASLMIALPCRLCGAPMASLNLTSGGYLEFCSRRGCKGHALGGVGDIDQMINLMNRMFETPYD